MGMAMSRVTNFQRDLSAAYKLKGAFILLGKIRDELNPDGFTKQEVRDEFFHHTSEDGGSSGHHMQLEKDFKILEDEGLLEETRPGVYVVTAAGKDFELNPEELPLEEQYDE